MVTRYRKLLIILLLSLFPAKYLWDTWRIYSAINRDDVQKIVAISERSPGLINRFNWIDGKTPLMYAVEVRARNAYRALLKHGANPNQLGFNGRNLMTLAAAEPDCFWLQTALDHGGDPNLDSLGTISHRCSPLLVAVTSPETMNNIILLVESYGADINQIIHNKDPLIMATQTGNYKATLYLLEHGADFRRSIHRYSSFARSMRYLRPDSFVDPAISQDLLNVIEWLEAHGVQYDKPRFNGESYVY